MYDQVANPKGSRLRKLQDWFTRAFTLAPALFYSTRVIPYRRPINVVGKSWYPFCIVDFFFAISEVILPISLEKINREGVNTIYCLPHVLQF